MPWSTYKAAELKSTGLVLGPKFDPNVVETESTGQRCVKLTASGQYVEFRATADANALVVRYSLPDARAAGGTNTSIDLLVNSVKVRTLDLTSRFSRLYGTYPFSNHPDQGKPRNFYDELRAKGL